MKRVLLKCFVFFILKVYVFFVRVILRSKIFLKFFNRNMKFFEENIVFKVNKFF